jgi:hypothetical protein
MSKSAKTKQDAERRRFVRHVIRGQARVEPLDEQMSDGHSTQVTIRDICRVGLLVECERELEIGSTWRMRFIDHNYCLGTVPFIVRNCRKVGQSRHHVGGMFMIEPFILKHLGIDDRTVLNEGLESSVLNGDFSAPEAA